MQLGDKIIYLKFRGKMEKVEEPRLPERANFVITWRGLDWSGFRTLAECERQFDELEKRDGDEYAVVER
jgi:hypothetical protein